jgi:hypothetical protein
MYSTLTVNSSQFSSQTGNEAAFIESESNSKFYLSGSSFSNGIGTQAGAINAQFSTAFITNVAFVGITSKEQGALYFRSESSVNINAASFTECGSE